MYIGRVSPGTSTEDILAYVHSSLGIDDAKCELLTNSDDISSFKLGVREDVLKSLLDPEKWPANVAIKEFIPRRRINNRGTFQSGN